MRKNPTLTTSSRNLKPIIDGIEVPIAVGKNMDALEAANAMPEVDMTPNNGGGPKVSSPPFAVGPAPKGATSPRGASPYDSRPGCNG